MTSAPVGVSSMWIHAVRRCVKLPLPPVTGWTHSPCSNAPEAGSNDAQYIIVNFSAARPAPACRSRRSRSYRGTP